PAQSSAVARLVGLDVEGSTESFLRSIILRGEPHLTETVSPSDLRNVAPTLVQETIRQFNPASCMVAPLIARDRRMGALTVARTAGNRCYTTDDLKLLQELGRRAAVALDNERLYRESQEATRLREQFLATISHELRTPLTAVAGWTSILSKME